MRISIQLSSFETYALTATLLDLYIESDLVCKVTFQSIKRERES